MGHPLPGIQSLGSKSNGSSLKHCPTHFCPVPPNIRERPSVPPTYSIPILSISFKRSAGDRRTAPLSATSTETSDPRNSFANAIPAGPLPITRRSVRSVSGTSPSPEDENTGTTPNLKRRASRIRQQRVRAENIDVVTPRAAGHGWDGGRRERWVGVVPAMARGAPPVAWASACAATAAASARRPRHQVASTAGCDACGRGRAPGAAAHRQARRRPRTARRDTGTPTTAPSPPPVRARRPRAVASPESRCHRRARTGRALRLRPDAAPPACLRRHGAAAPGADRTPAAGR